MGTAYNMLPFAVEETVRHPVQGCPCVGTTVLVHMDVAALANSKNGIGTVVTKTKAAIIRYFIYPA
jgi:hypothetical protein